MRKKKSALGLLEVTYLKLLWPNPKLKLFWMADTETKRKISGVTNNFIKSPLSRKQRNKHMLSNKKIGYLICF